MTSFEKIKLFFEKGYSLDKNGVVFNKNGKTVIGYNKRLKNYISKEICIKHNGKSINIVVSRIQAYQKYGEKMFEKGIVVRHLNGNSTDNSWDNIKIGSQSDNMMDIPDEIRILKSKNATRKRQDSIRTLEERYAIYKDLLDMRLSMRGIMIKHNISSYGTIFYMKNKSQEYKEYIESGHSTVG